MRADQSEKVAQTLAQTVARNIQEAMDRRGLNALELSRRADLNPTAIYDILKEKIKSPRVDTLGKIAHALHLPASSLLEDHNIDDIRAGLLAALEYMSTEDQKRLLDVANGWKR